MIYLTVGDLDIPAQIPAIYVHCEIARNSYATAESPQFIGWEIRI